MLCMGYELIIISFFQMFVYIISFKPRTVLIHIPFHVNFSKY